MQSVALLAQLRSCQRHPQRLNIRIAGPLKPHRLGAESETSVSAVKANFFVTPRETRGEEFRSVAELHLEHARHPSRSNPPPRPPLFPDASSSAHRLALFWSVRLVCRSLLSSCLSCCVERVVAYSQAHSPSRIQQASPCTKGSSVRCVFVRSKPDDEQGQQKE